MADEKIGEIEAQASATKQEKIQPILFKSKAFSVCRLQKKFTLVNKPNKQNEVVTTKNTLPLLKKEAEQDNIVKEVVDSSYKMAEKQKSKRQRWINFGFLMLNLVILAIILFFQIRSEGAISFADLVSSQINLWWLLAAVLLFFLINALDSARIAISIKQVTGRYRPFLSYKSTAICRFYDCITPLSTGGQPFQIFYLSKRGLNASTASSVPLSKYVFAQIVFIFYTGTLLVTSLFMNLNINPILRTLSWIGLLLNALLIVLIFMLSVSKKVAPRMVIGFLKFGSKLHLVKDYQATFKKVIRTVKQYTATFKMFMKSGWNAFLQTIITIIFLTAAYSIPFVIYCMFTSEPSLEIWFQLMILQIVCDLAISFIPIPGGGGSAELSFGALFGQYFKNCASGITVWAMLFWRILAYYGYLLQGILVILYDYLFGNKKIAPLLQKFKDEDKRRASDLYCEIERAEKLNKKASKTQKKKGKGEV